MLSNISANSIRRSTIPCDTFSRPSPRSEPLTSTPLSATRSRQKKPPKARHNRITYHHERRAWGARLSSKPLASKSPTPSGFFGDRSRKIRDPNLLTNPRPNHAKFETSLLASDLPNPYPGYAFGFDIRRNEFRNVEKFSGRGVLLGARACSTYKRCTTK